MCVCACVYVLMCVAAPGLLLLDEPTAFVCLCVSACKSC